MQENSMQVDFYYEFGRNRICSEMLFVKIFHFYCISFVDDDYGSLKCYVRFFAAFYFIKL